PPVKYLSSFASSYPIHKAETYSGVNPTNQASFICPSPSDRLVVPVFPAKSLGLLQAVGDPSFTTLCNISGISMATCDEHIFYGAYLMEEAITYIRVNYTLIIYGSHFTY